MGTKKRSSPKETTELLLPERQVDTRLNLPPLYTVYVLNDDYTPMDFVVEVLMRYFLMDQVVATQMMLQIHQKGRANCGFYTREIAETKVVQVNEYARRNQYPLLCGMIESGAE
ncbi:MAG TPA: ATP-dependent Clp protease adapter ClpS [Gammaproteobacteria bacterium]|nr:ATP-dependent Clp protease adapter ClpS [Gammaproteobacteria bacterium]HRA42121.1 ATP-dependent Clp protease adapter ClpS [Gammaproteobacteria bacterium]